MTTHCCCTPNAPCSRAAVLFAKRMTSALTAHLEKLVDAPADKEPAPREKRSHFKVPVATAPTWSAETVPLREFLRAAPRDWSAIHAWADDHRVPEYVLHNQVAWLEGAGLARATMLGAAGGSERQRAIWRAT